MDNYEDLQELLNTEVEVEEQPKSLMELFNRVAGIEDPDYVHTTSEWEARKALMDGIMDEIDHQKIVETCTQEWMETHQFNTVTMKIWLSQNDKMFHRIRAQWRDRKVTDAIAYTEFFNYFESMHFKLISEEAIRRFRVIVKELFVLDLIGIEDIPYLTKNPSFNLKKKVGYSLKDEDVVDSIYGHNYTDNINKLKEYHTKNLTFDTRYWKLLDDTAELYLTMYKGNSQLNKNAAKEIIKQNLRKK